MSLNTHNIVAPTSWGIYDLVDRPVPAKTGVYPSPDVFQPQPTLFYTDSSLGRVFPAGTVMASDITFLPITDLYPRYVGPTSVTPFQGEYVFQTAGKIVSQNIVVNPIPSCYGLVTWDGSKLLIS